MRNTLILVFSSLCAINIAAGILAPNTPAGEAVGRALAPLRSSLGLLQQWSMFDTIPIHRDFEMRVIAAGADGSERRYGPELPGLEEFEIRRRNRTYYTFARMFDSEPELRDAYLEKVATALHEEDPELVEFRVLADLHYIRHLFHIRKDGEFTKVVPSEFGPFPVIHEGDR